MNRFWGVDADPTAQGRIKGARPVAVLDIGSNSVRLVVYERHSRALTPLYNEKTACALGRGIATSGRLADENAARALGAIKRFALVAKLMRVGQVHILATSAVRDAANRAEFVAAVERLMGTGVTVLSGEEEAHFAALGVVSGMPGFAGLAGDLGGGSIELSSVSDGHDRAGETFELGVIRLQDDSAGSPKAARQIVADRLAGSKLLGEAGAAPSFAAIGGTWRTLAKIHQIVRAHPLRMVQDYQVAAGDIAALCDEIVATESLTDYPGAQHASSSRRELVPFGAAVLGEVVRAGRFESVVFSALGVREGYLYGLLDAAEQGIDPLIQSAEEMSLLRSRSPAHADDLVSFTDFYAAATGLEETTREARLRRVACLLADIGWRAHPDYRGVQSVDAVAYGALPGVDHGGRAFLAEVLAVRYLGNKGRSVVQNLRKLTTNGDRHRARLIGTLFRVAYPMSAAMPGILPRTRFSVAGGELILTLPRDLAFLDGEHLRGRLASLAEAGGFRSSQVTTG